MCQVACCQKFDVFYRFEIALRFPPLALNDLKIRMFSILFYFLCPITERLLLFLSPRTLPDSDLPHPFSSPQGASNGELRFCSYRSAVLCMKPAQHCADTMHSAVQVICTVLCTTPAQTCILFDLQFYFGRNVARRFQRCRGA